MAKEIAIYFMGKKYHVPEGLTILKAIEYSGYQLIRGCGCRGGFCGACATVYRVPGDHRLKVGLACQTQVEEEMTLTILPFYPAIKREYDLDTISDPLEAIQSLYPEVYRCMGCNACTNICPQDLSVMNYIANIQRGNLYRAAELSFDCIMCGLCASRCLAQMVPYDIALFARRLYAKFSLKKPHYVEQRIKEIKSGQYVPEINELMEMDLDSLQKIYSEREMEKI